jgi:hypothetical protein
MHLLQVGGRVRRLGEVTSAMPEGLRGATNDSRDRAVCGREGAADRKTGGTNVPGVPS